MCWDFAAGVKFASVTRAEPARMRTDMTVDEGRRIDAEQHCDARAHKILTTFMSMRPLIAICGTTGVGKSKFALMLVPDRDF